MHVARICVGCLGRDLPLAGQVNTLAINFDCELGCGEGKSWDPVHLRSNDAERAILHPVSSSFLKCERSATQAWRIHHPKRENDIVVNDMPHRTAPVSPTNVVDVLVPVALS